MLLLDAGSDYLVIDLAWGGQQLREGPVGDGLGNAGTPVSILRGTSITASNPPDRFLFAYAKDDRVIKRRLSTKRRQRGFASRAPGGHSPRSEPLASTVSALHGHRKRPDYAHQPLLMYFLDTSGRFDTGLAYHGRRYARFQSDKTGIPTGYQMRLLWMPP